MSKAGAFFFPAKVGPDGLTIRMEGIDEHNRYFLSSFDSEIEIAVRKRQVSKSGQQVRYWWGVLVPFVANWIQSQEGKSITNLGPERVHDWIMLNIAGGTSEEITVLGKKIVVLNRCRLSEMTQLEVSHAIDAVRLFMSEQGEDLPDSNL